MQSVLERAVYVNALDDSGKDAAHRIREAYGPNYDRLVQLKKNYDPTNFFRNNHNIQA
jgi:hypothetical protein